MLAREHRLRSSDEIREVVKSGKRVSNSIATIHFLPSDSNQFAVVTSKAVGNAVKRNLVKRRCRAVLYETQSGTPGVRAVVRLRPPASEASWEIFSVAMRELLARAR